MIELHGRSIYPLVVMALGWLALGYGSSVADEMTGTPKFGRAL
jgi:hypothetical protein